MFFDNGYSALKFADVEAISFPLSPPPPHADGPTHNSSETDRRPLDELLAFIEGPHEDGEGGGVSSVAMTINNTTSKTGKKKKKTKKIQVRIFFPTGCELNSSLWFPSNHHSWQQQMRIAAPPSHMMCYQMLCHCHVRTHFWTLREMRQDEVTTQLTNQIERLHNTQLTNQIASSVDTL